MAENLGDAVLELKTDNRGLTGGLKRGEASAKRGIGRIAGAIGKHNKAVGAGMTVVGAAIAGVGLLAVKSFAGFEQSIARAGALAGATGKELEQFSDIAKSLGRTTQFSATDAAGALAFLSQAGFEVTESTKALPGVLQLAAAANLDLATSADITSNVLSGYGFKVEELARVNDVLTKAFTSANTDLLQLGQALKFAGPVASAAGIGFEEATAAIASMGNAGIQASMAGTSLRGAITRLLNPSAEAEDIINRLGVTVTDSSGKMVPLVEIVAQLEKRGLTAADAMVVFGQHAGPGMLALVQQGSESLKQFTADLKDSAGTAAGIAARQMATFQGTIIRLKSTKGQSSG